MQALDERSKQLLKLLIEQYIQHGQPVGSKSLAGQPDFPLSSATIRNIMAELEKVGYLHSPHTSAGRIPTDQAYRFFVDHLLMNNELLGEEACSFPQDMESHPDTTALIKNASQVLSSMTQLAGLVSLPKRNRISLKQIEFLALSDKHILAILVFNDREVQNRVIQTDRAFSASELQETANFLNEQYVGKDLLTIRHALLRSMKEDQQTMNRLMKTALDMASQAFQEDIEQEDYVLVGESNLLGLAHITGVDRMQLLFEAFTQKQMILELLDKCLTAVNTQIFIGKESGYAVLDHLSIIATPYQTEGEILGVLGVIGPTRMPYDKIIPVVNMTAKWLSNALTE
ncbi:MAG: heat-inducible transcriptional repressor HrcA [Gammaproteobacteria bacterium GWE2_42_36]|nr:MAG: heat-inducible transcriptional repressor HrcA [Gammaproteobacteria bacterium GWE2_42_36]HCU05056.1 heat-inducible transcription repressor HrcA [Coxiellaceae bacterium]